MKHETYKNLNWYNRISAVNTLQFMIMNRGLLFQWTFEKNIKISFKGEGCESS